MACAADCGTAPLTPLAGAVHRITDRQGESGTADLVDGLREQALSGAVDRNRQAADPQRLAGS